MSYNPEIKEGVNMRPIDTPTSFFLATGRDTKQIVTSHRSSQ